MCVTRGLKHLRDLVKLFASQLLFARSGRMHRFLIDELQFKKQIKAEEIHIQEQNKPRTAAFISQYITLFKILLQFITLHNISKCFLLVLYVD